MSALPARPSRAWAPSEAQIRYAVAMVHKPDLKTRAQIARHIKASTSTIKLWWQDDNFRLWLRTQIEEPMQNLVWTAAMRRVMAEIGNSKSREGAQAATRIVLESMKKREEPTDQRGLLAVLARIGSTAPAHVQVHPLAQSTIHAMEAVEDAQIEDGPDEGSEDSA